MSPYIGYDSDTTFLPGTVNTSSSLTIQGGGITQTGGDVNFDSGTLFIDEDLNRVGIGITTPGAPLDVNGAIHSQSGGIYSNAFVSYNGVEASINAGTSQFYVLVNAQERLRITSAGNVGIGTTTSYTVGGDYRVTILGSDILSAGPSSSNMFYIRNQGSVGDFAWQTVNAGSNSGSIQLQPYGGNVGIGTTNPTTPLHIYKDSNNLLTLDNATADTQKIFFAQSGETHANIYASSSSGALTIDADPSGNHTSTYINFIIDGGEKARINSSGNVGIGTNSPGTLLDLFKYTGTSGTSNGTTLINLRHAVGTGPSSLGDITGLFGQKTFIDFTFTDANVNFTPQVRIGAEVGSTSTDLGIASEGNGSFVVYTAQGVDELGDGSLTEKFRVTGNGNVGINTNNPGTELHVQGTNGYAELRLSGYSGSGGSLEYYDATTKLADIYADSSSSIVFRNTASNTERLRITSTGVLKVGTNLYNGSYTGEKIVVAAEPTAGDSSTVVIGEEYNGSANPSISLFRRDGATLYSAYGYRISNFVGKLNFSYASTALPGSHSFDPKVTFTQTGNVGIGTTNPETKLDVVGNIRASTNIAVVNNSSFYVPLSLGDTGAGANEKYWRFTLSRTSKSLEIGTQNDASTAAYSAISITRTGTNIENVIFSTLQNNERLRITSTGNVGIGTTNPYSALGMRGDITLGLSPSPGGSYGRLSWRYNNSASFGASAYIDVTQVSAGNSGNMIFATNNNTPDTAEPTERLRITSAGTLALNPNGSTGAGTLLDIFGGSPSGTRFGAIRIGDGTISGGHVNYWDIGRDNTTNGNFTLALNGTERVCVDINGNVGVGTTGPTVRLDTRGVISATDGFVNVLRGDITYPKISIFPNGTASDIVGDVVISGYYPIVFRTDLGLERMRIARDGNVGIGTTNPVRKLQVGAFAGTPEIIIAAGTTGAPALLFGDGPTGSDAYRGFVRYDHSTNSLDFATNATSRLIIDSSGNTKPTVDATYDLGSPTARWANIYSADLQLSNEGSPTGNEVDGTWGAYTIQEGEEALYLINRRSGKKFKFVLEEVK